MKTITACAALLCCAALLAAQTTFNLRDRYGFEAATICSIIPTDSCYYASGIIADTFFPYKTGSLFMRLDLLGNPVWVKTLTSTEKTYETWENSLHRTPDNGFALSGYVFDPAMKAILIKFDQDGDTVFTREFLNPYYPAHDFIRPIDLKIADNGDFLLLNWIGVPPTIASANASILKTDSQGHQIFHKEYGTDLRDIPQRLLLDGEGGSYIGAVRTNIAQVAENYIYQCEIIKVGGQGSQEWSYLSPPGAGLRDAANDLLLLGDGSIVVASGVGHEQDWPSVNRVYFDRQIFKLTPQLEIDWELTFPDSALTGWARTTNLVEMSDGSGYVVAGIAYNTQPPPKYYTVRGWLAKVSPDGDSVWTRRYAFLADGENEHNIYDMKETPDGGLILCGEAKDRGNGATYPQQGWLLKLDGHGCLVPGCHLSDGAVEAALPQPRLAAYPNPTSGYLNFYVQGPLAGTASFRIVDGAGRAVREFGGSSTWGTTFVVPVEGWPPGTYWLQYLVDGALRAVEAVVVVP